jgi:hypothetical protein
MDPPTVAERLRYTPGGAIARAGIPALQGGCVLHHFTWRAQS